MSEAERASATTSCGILKNDSLAIITLLMVTVASALVVSLPSGSGHNFEDLVMRLLALTSMAVLAVTLCVARIHRTRRILLDGMPVLGRVTQVAHINIPRIHYVAYTVRYEMGGKAYRIVIRDGPPASIRAMEGDNVTLKVDPRNPTRALAPNRYLRAGGRKT